MEHWNCAAGIVRVMHSACSLHKVQFRWSADAGCRGGRVNHRFLDSKPFICCLVSQDALRPAQSAAQDAIQQLARLVSQQPDLQFPISGDKAQAWLINTYLDEVNCLLGGEITEQICHVVIPN